MAKATTSMPVSRPLVASTPIATMQAQATGAARRSARPPTTSTAVVVMSLGSARRASCAGRLTSNLSTHSTTLPPPSDDSVTQFPSSVINASAAALAGRKKGADRLGGGDRPKEDRRGVGRHPWPQCTADRHVDVVRCCHDSRLSFGGHVHPLLTIRRWLCRTSTHRHGPHRQSGSRSPSVDAICLTGAFGRRRERGILCGDAAMAVSLARLEVSTEVIASAAFRSTPAASFVCSSARAGGSSLSASLLNRLVCTARFVRLRQCRRELEMPAHPQKYLVRQNTGGRRA